MQFSSTDSIHEHLKQLSPQHLCETLGKVQARSAMLALCGLPNQVTSAVLALLPKAESRKVREAMNSLGALQLREIDQAKEAVAYASLEVVNVPIPNVA
jgi:flagellar motor switch protein FliG